MKKIFVLFSILAVAFIISSCRTVKVKVTGKALESGFITPPDSMQTSVYWYWISDNISKEGVVKDLQSMKKVSYLFLSLNWAERKDCKPVLDGCSDEGVLTDWLNNNFIRACDSPMIYKRK